MQQLTQKLKDGAMCVHEVPVPALGSGTVLVRNLYSLVSVGTEGSTVKAARSSLIEKAKQRPQQVQQVLEVVKSQGPVQAWRAVMKKLDAYSPLGYSGAGKVHGAGCRAHGKKESRTANGAKETEDKEGWVSLSFQRVFDADPADNLTMVEIFRPQNFTSSAFSGYDDQRIPKR